MPLRILILAAGVGAGHNQAAGAIEGALGRVPEVGDVKRIDILETTNEIFAKLYDDAYFTLVSEVPWVVGWGYDSQDAPFNVPPLVRWWDQLNTTDLVRDIRDFDPDLVICTHYLPARLVALMLTRRQLRASLTLVATDYDFQGLWLTSPFTHFFVARQESRELMVRLGVPADRVRVSGIPVRPGLDQPVDERAVRASFGLEPHLPVVLISAGASGGSYTLNIVRQVLRCEQPFQAVVVCGRNEALRAEVNALVSRRQERFSVLGFTDRMADLMGVATLFVGKPGGLSSSECMAAGLPMVIVNPIPGQEMRNADFLLEEGAAIRCNYPATVGYKIDTLLADPERVAAMAASARRIGRPNAGQSVVEGSLELLTPPLWISRDAQRSMLQASQDGSAVVDLEPAKQLQTLTDPITGGSLAVMTRGQLSTLGVTTWSTSVTIARSSLKRLRWQTENIDLAVSGRWLLHGAKSRDFGLL
ncbi:MGDG synthase family glycosyltransferase [Micropruina sp.]|uniref:MGDG synthase family glycosyltransferase n=1 Tax=Micropruina sp. TaxID=2737536 RepID=UPI0039E4A076